MLPRQHPETIAVHHQLLQSLCDIRLLVRVDCHRLDDRYLRGEIQSQDEGDDGGVVVHIVEHDVIPTPMGGHFPHEPVDSLVLQQIFLLLVASHTRKTAYVLQNGTTLGSWSENQLCH